VTESLSGAEAPTSSYATAVIVAFAGNLRSRGVSRGQARVLTAISGAILVDVTRREDLKNALKAALVSDPSGAQQFDEAFDRFFGSAVTLDHSPDQDRAQPDPMAPSPSPGEGPGVRVEVQQHSRYSDRLWDTVPLRADSEFGPTDALSAYSPVETSRHAPPFSTLEPALTNSLACEQPQFRLSRRRRPSVSGRLIDLRRTLATSSRRHGELLELKRATRQRRPAKTLVLCDISGSMQSNASSPVRTLHKARRNDGETELFLFGTRLHRITRLLDGSDFEGVMRRLTQLVPEWGGGTRIGESLRQFNRSWANRILARSSTVIIVSDGWDLGPADALKREVDRIHRNCARLIWMSPLMSTPGYRPVTAALAASLEHVDALLPLRELPALLRLEAPPPKFVRSS